LLLFLNISLAVCVPLQELAALGEAGSVDRVDSFLKRFSHTHASLPERMHTPVLRVNTPMVSLLIDRVVSLSEWFTACQASFPGV